MAQDGRYPSPDLTNSAHPYHNSPPQVAGDPTQHLQHAPTAMMHEAHADNPAVPQGFHYVAQYGNPSPSTPQQLAQQTLDVDRGQSIDSSSAKKTKVSRACDECRRKKVRCDAESDQPGVQCSNCKRLSLACQFSRQPQKRGPSKGYIRELAERVSRLEYPPGTSPESPYPPMTQDSQFQGQADYATPNSRKRTHSTAENSGALSHALDNLQEFTRAPNLAPQSPAPHSNSQVIQPPVYDLPASISGTVLAVPESILEGYTRHIHSVLPLLPESRELLSYVDKVSPELRQSFTESLTIAVKACESIIHPTDVKQAVDRCLSLQKNRRSIQGNFGQAIFLYTLTLMAIADEVSGPASSRSGLFLGSAIAFANSLRAAKPSRSGDPEKDESSKMVRRAWLSLVILDRWHAAGTCGATLINDEDIRLEVSDHLLLGSSAYHMLRISLALGHLSNIFLHHEQEIAERHPSSRMLTQLMQGEVARIHESIESLLPQMPHVHLAYLHVKLLSDKASEAVEPSDATVIDAALHIVQIFATQSVPCSVLDHHFGGLAAAILCLALDAEYTTAPSPSPSVNSSVTDSLKRLGELCEGEQFAPAWREPIASLIATKLEPSQGKNGSATPTAQQAKLKRGGLDQLANAAVGDVTGDQDGTGLSKMQWTGIMGSGYMSLFDQE